MLDTEVRSKRVRARGEEVGENFSRKMLGCIMHKKEAPDPPAPGGHFEYFLSNHQVIKGWPGCPILWVVVLGCVFDGVALVCHTLLLDGGPM